jgi:hypothetical protein
MPVTAAPITSCALWCRFLSGVYWMGCVLCAVFTFKYHYFPGGRDSYYAAFTPCMILHWSLPLYAPFSIVLLTRKPFDALAQSGWLAWFIIGEIWQTLPER